MWTWQMFVVSYTHLPCVIDRGKPTSAGGDARAREDGGFSVRAMVDAVMAPDVLQLVVERITQRKREG